MNPQDDIKFEVDPALYWIGAGAVLLVLGIAGIESEPLAELAWVAAFGVILRGLTLPSPGPEKSATGLRWVVLGIVMVVFGLALVDAAGDSYSPSNAELLASFLGSLMFLFSPLAFLRGLMFPYLYNFLRGRSENDDRSLFALQLADTVQMGLPLDEALSGLSETEARQFWTRYSSVCPALEGMARRVAQGEDLASAVESARGFPAYWAAFLRRSADMVRTLGRLSRLESSRFRMPTHNAAATLAKLAMFVAISWFLVSYILPTFVQLFEGMSLKLPLTTAWLITLVKLARNPVFVLPLLVLILVMPFFARVRQAVKRGAARLPGVWDTDRQTLQPRGS